MKAISTITSSNFETQGSRICEYCGTKVPIYYLKNKDKTVSQCLKCENKKLQNECQKEYENFQKNMNKAIFKRNSLISSDILASKFSSYKPNHPSQHEALRIAMSYAKNFDKIKEGEGEYNSILFQGSYGLGKSHLSYAIATEVMQKGFSTIFIDIPQLLQVFRENIQTKKFSEQQIMKSISEASLVIFDDLGAEYIKQDNGKESWAVDKLFQLFSLKTNRAKIITTNYNAKKLQDKYGDHGGRIISRMMMGTKRIAMEGNDYRIKK